MPTSSDQFLRDYSALFDRVYRYIRARCSNAEDARDLVAQVMLKAYEKISSYSAEKGSLEQWVIGIAQHAIVDHWRKQKSLLSFDDITPHAKPRVALEIDDFDDRLAFEHLIRSVSDEAKALLRLRYIDDMS